MSLIQESSVFKSSYDFLKELHIARGRFIKAEKYTLGELLENTALSLLLYIIDAGKQKREWKIPPLESALLAQEKLKILVRLALDLKQIPERRYIDFEKRLQEIGRMLGGWRKSL